MSEITDGDYERIEYHKGINHDSFRVLRGRYKGAVITFGVVGIHEQMDGRSPKLKYEFQLDEPPLDMDELRDSAAFHGFIGDMLVHILRTAMDENNFAIGNKGKRGAAEFTDNDSPESD